MASYYRKQCAGLFRSKIYRKQYWTTVKLDDIFDISKKKGELEDLIINN